MKRPRFSLRTLLVITALLCLPLAWYAVERKAISERREALHWLSPLYGMRYGDVIKMADSYQRNPSVSAITPISGLGESSIDIWLFGRQPGLQLLEVYEEKFIELGKYNIEEIKALFPEASIAALRDGKWVVISDGANIYSASPPPYRRTSPNR